MFVIPIGAIAGKRNLVNGCPFVLTQKNEKVKAVVSLTINFSFG